MVAHGRAPVPDAPEVERELTKYKLRMEAEERQLLGRRTEGEAP